MKKLTSMLLALALVLSLAACGNSDDVAGDDWRTTGMVIDSGTITHDGDSVDVLVTVSESSAAFYRDIPEQVLFDSVAFPMDIPDAEQAFHSISFDDLDGEKPASVYDMVLKSVERPMLEVVMEQAGGNQTLASEMLGINRNTLRKKLTEHQLL